MAADASEVDYFCAFFDAEVVDLIVTETNRYYRFFHSGQWTYALF